MFRSNQCEHPQSHLAHWLIATAICAMAVFQCAPALSDTEAPPHTPGAWPSAHAQLARLHAFAAEPAADLDTVLPLIDQLTFTMGMLCNETELADLLEQIESIDGPLNGLVRSALWMGYGNERAVRRIGEISEADIESYLLTLSRTDAPATRSIALTLLAARPTESDDPSTISATRVHALNELAATASIPRALDRLLAEAMVDHVASQWGIGSTPKSFYESYPWNESVLNAAATREGSHAFLESISQQPGSGLNALLTAAVHHETPAARRAARDLIDILDRTHAASTAPLQQLASMMDNEPAGVPGGNDPGKADLPLMVMLFNDAVRDGRLHDAQRYLTALQPNDLSAIDSPAVLLRATNALGMALVREGREDEAVAVFTTLASFYPGSQSANFAEQHISHLLHSDTAD